MSIPTTPNAPTPAPEESAAQQRAQAQAQAQARQSAETRALATELEKKQDKLDFEPSTIRKAKITGVSLGASVPVLAAQLSGDTTTTINNIRFMDSYTPVVGDTVLLLKQGPDVFALGQIASSTGMTAAAGWVQPALSSGFSHGGNSGGALKYRRINDNGTWKVRWEGIVARSSGTTILSGLPTELRPAAKRVVLAPRNPSGGNNTALVAFNTDGTVTLEGLTTTASASASSTTPSGSLGTTTVSGTTGSAGGGGGGNTGTSSIVADIPHSHSHGGSVSNTTFSAVTTGAHSHTVDGTSSHSHTYNAGAHSHTVSVDSHTHTITNSVSEPEWVSLDGIEYAL